MNTNRKTELCLPAHCAPLAAEELVYLDGGLSINPLNWFKNITMSVTISWNGSVLASQYPKWSWLFKQLGLNLKFTLS